MHVSLETDFFLPSSQTSDYGANHRMVSNLRCHRQKLMHYHNRSALYCEQIIHQGAFSMPATTVCSFLARRVEGGFAGAFKLFLGRLDYSASRKRLKAGSRASRFSLPARVLGHLVAGWRQRFLLQSMSTSGAFTLSLFLPFFLAFLFAALCFLISLVLSLLIAASWDSSSFPCVPLLPYLPFLLALPSLSCTEFIHFALIFVCGFTFCACPVLYPFLSLRLFFLLIWMLNFRV